MRLSEHFSDDEFRCHCREKGHDGPEFCGGKVWVSPTLVLQLETLRARLGGHAITINSGCRCQAYNATLPGSASSSRHILGAAADIVVEGVPPDEVADEAERMGFGGVGRYDTFTHVDVREQRGRWDSRTKRPRSR